MKLVLRKENSSTSILLFLFNMYLNKTGKDYIKLSSLLEYMKAFGKNETTTRMSLSRTVKIGLLINIRQDNEVIYSLTPEGKEYVLLWNEGVINFWKRYKFRNSEWNSKWYVVNIDFKKENNNKVIFIDKLEQLGFAQINTYTWLTPYYQHEEVKKLIEQYDLAEGVIETYGEIKIHRELEEFLDEIYGIKKLRVLYQQFIESYEKKLLEIKQLCNDPDFVNEGLALPIFQEMGWSFFDIAAGDAALPRQLLPQWEGDEAASVLREMRGILENGMYKYFEKYD